jgi:DNA segregation ATPase FtsK/SpoIIIE, S-DNA-T family
MRASGRPPHSHRDPARPVRGGDRPGLSLGALAHRLMALRASLARRLSGAGGPSRIGYAAPGRRAEPSWLTAPAALVGREEMEPRPATPRTQRPAWPERVFDDRASLDREDDGEPLFESRIDREASSPGVLVRQPRRPAAIAPEEPVPAAPAPVPASVRYTRTPDTVLQERRQRALEAERVALERARAEAQAAAQALEAERAAREQAAREDEVQAEAGRREAEAQAALAAVARAAQAEADEAVRAASALPLWRQPFVAPPGVRYFRTPDRRPSRLVRPAGLVPGAAVVRRRRLVLVRGLGGAGAGPRARPAGRGRRAGGDGP